MFSGYKTHALVVGGLLTILGMFISGDLTAGEAVQRAMEVLSISALRVGVDAAKKEGGV